MTSALSALMNPPFVKPASNFHALSNNFILLSYSHGQNVVYSDKDHHKSTLKYFWALLIAGLPPIQLPTLTIPLKICTSGLPGNSRASAHSLTMEKNCVYNSAVLNLK